MQIDKWVLRHPAQDDQVMHMVEFITYVTQSKAMLDKHFYWVITFFLHLQIKQIDFHLEVIY